MPLPIRILGVAIFAMIALGLLVEGNRYLLERLVFDLALPGAE